MSSRLSGTMPIIEWPAADQWRNVDDVRRVAKALDDACRQSGYFVLRGHGVSSDLIAAAFNETGRFYSLPSDEKKKFTCTRDSQFLGYRGLGAEKSRMHSGAEACEQYRIGHVIPALQAQPWVDFYHEPFRQGTVLFQELVTLGNQIVSTCAIGLGVADTFFDPFLTAPMHRLGFNYFPVGGGTAIGNSVNYAMTPHVDHVILTMLTQDEPGLEVLSPDDRWIDVPMLPDTLFVFLGDYMQRWTNGAYRATPHRVREVSTNRRSLQYKHKPSFATVVEPLSQFVDAGHPARYEPFDTGQQYSELLQSLLSK